jgi:hypothetical protein
MGGIHSIMLYCIYGPSIELPINLGNVREHDVWSEKKYNITDDNDLLEII